MFYQKKLRLFTIIIVICLAVSLITVSLSSCRGDNTVTGGTGENSSTVETTTKPISPAETTAAILGTDSPYLLLDLSEYIKINKYTGLTIKITDPDLTKSDAVWQEVVSAAEVIKYPEEQVLYYFEQTKEKYMDQAMGDEEQYQIVLDYCKITEEDMMEEARQMVKEDLVYYYMVNDSHITLSDDEKQGLFDKYVAFYVDNYKYPRDYVIANMSSLIYDSMLYDKTMEFLILNNTFIIETDTTVVSSSTAVTTTKK